jgi:hypothetical protein
MAKGQQRSNRETKKPKQVKPKARATAGVPSMTKGKPGAVLRTTKK